MTRNEIRHKVLDTLRSSVGGLTKDQVRKTLQVKTLDESERREYVAIGQILAELYMTGEILKNGEVYSSKEKT